VKAQSRALRCLTCFRERRSGVKQDFDEAVRTNEALVATYTVYGYELVELPRVSLEERVSFVLRTTNLRSATV
jgi:predicted ATPase